MNGPDQRPGPMEFAPTNAGEVALVPDGNVLEGLLLQLAETNELLSGLEAARAELRYAPGKWSVKEVLGHVLDAERIFAYRALCVARGERHPLPAFAENDYAANADLSGISLAELLEQFGHVRRGNVLFFRSLRDADWARRGTANGHTVTARGLAYVIDGHARHHVGILRTRYLLAEPKP